MPTATTYTQKLPNGTSFDLILVKAGSFFIGNSDHEIHLPDFYLAKYPVTQALWLAVMGGENPAYFKGMNRPIERVSWYDAAAFCNSLNHLCNFPPRYFCDASFQKALDFSMTQPLEYGDSLPIFIHPENPGYRLPSESAWEYAAIGARQRSLYEYAGGNTLDELGWYSENSHGQTQPVGLKMPNELGLHDLSGNVWEWCEDQYQDKRSEIPPDGSAWTQGDVGADRVLRGGGWYPYAHRCRSSFRFDYPPATRLNDIGFRLVLFPLQSAGLASNKAREQKKRKKKKTKREGTMGVPRRQSCEARADRQRGAGSASGRLWYARSSSPLAQRAFWDRAPT